MPVGAAPTVDAGALVAWVRDAHARTGALTDDLTDAQCLVPRLPTINPMVWESCHAAYFYERFVLLEHGLAGVDPAAESLYDSIGIAHETRWDLPVPGRDRARAYIATVHDRVCEALDAAPDDDRLRFLVRYAVLHEDMHGEALTYCRQTCAYPAPRPLPGGRRSAAAPPTGDVALPGGEYLLGAPHDAEFCFDNEKWAHPVRLAPFAIARAPVTQGRFAAFVDDGGYARRECWSDAGWAWRTSAEATAPVYWRRQGAGWARRDFDRWVPIEPHRPVIHVCWWEAEAYCAWAGRRLPTEAEWEYAASGPEKRRFPWGDADGGAAHANLGAEAGGCVDAGTCAAGATPEGVAGLLGDAWEWCADTFGPFPGFAPDHYADYSVPLFGDTRVLRGGCWATRRRLACNGYRNYQTPDRRDIFAGFRTCASS